jgi:hypothetical protein
MAVYLVHRLGYTGIVEALAAATTAAGLAVARHGARDWSGYSRE